MDKTGGTMTPRQRKATTRFIVHMAILTIIGTLLVLSDMLILSNQAQLMIQQTDTLDKLNEISVVIDLEDSTPAAISETLPEGTTAVHSLTPDERDLVERVVAAESRGEDLQGQMAVAQTILDRAELWNMSVSEVVQAPGQYAAPYRGKVSDSIHLAVANVFDGGVRIFEGATFQFHDNTVDPYWTEGKIDRGSIGNLRFYGGYEK